MYYNFTINTLFYEICNDYKYGSLTLNSST